MASEQENAELYGMTSPGGFVFGVTGWVWAEPRPRTITFFLDNTVRVSDQYGRPIRGGMTGGPAGAAVLFAPGAPGFDDKPGARKEYASHAKVVAYLMDDLRLDWKTITVAGWPQLPYEELKKLPQELLPPIGVTREAQDGTIEQLRKIRDNDTRRGLLRLFREMVEAQAKELQLAASEE